MVVKRFNVWLANLDPTQGSEIKKSRPCLVISPDEMNKHINTVIIAPMTTKGRQYPTRISYRFREKNGFIVLDQIRCIDKSRLIEPLGLIDILTQNRVASTLQEMFTI